MNATNTDEFVFQAQSEADTARLGAALADVLPAGTTVGLIGTLGAGKTRLVQSVAAALGVEPEDVGSPTFVLINEYQGRRPIYHFDTYRLKDEDEFLELGPDEYFAGPGLTFVEWADRFARCLPESRLTIQIEVVGETARHFTISSHGELPATLLNELQAAIDRV